MKIAMFGIKGLPVPAGAENVAEQIGSRLVKRGHQVTIYVRPHYTPRTLKEYKGMRLIQIPSIPTKHLDAITHSFLACLAAIASDAEIIHIHATGNSVFAWLPRLFGKKTIVQSHGLDWQRAKWGRPAKFYLRMTDYTTTHFPNAVTAVSQKVQRYYQDSFHRPVIYIPNGVAPVQKVAPREMLQYGLQGNDYIFFAARLVPEKGCHYLLEAYRMLGQLDKKLVIAGDGAYGDSYAEELKKQANERILFLGFVQGRLLEELLSNAYLYVLPSEIEGLSVGLLEAMNYGNCVLVSNIEENLEAIGTAGLSFQSTSSADLADKLHLLLMDDALVSQYRNQAQQAVGEKYDWENVTDQYEALYHSLMLSAA
jgi:glycosyltransferase involved in cell wall biosynthesis